MTGHEKRLQAVREAFDANKLIEICLADEKALARYGTEFCKDNGKGAFAFYHKDNGEHSRVLAVAHMDSVSTHRDAGVVKMASGRMQVLSPQLDDRLGVYVICELLPKLGITTDILLTTGEETGNSTAKVFSTSKKYTWMFQFDRKGTDVVMYQYKTTEAFEKLEKLGFKTAIGSLSDISYLDDLGCLGFNFGVGYEDYHSNRSYAWLDDTFEQVARFVKFYKLYSREFMAYDKKASRSSFGSHLPSYEPNYTPYTPSSYTPVRDYSNEFGRQVDGVWWPRTKWDVESGKWVPSSAFYTRFPEEPGPSESILGRPRPYTPTSFPSSKTRIWNREKSCWEDFEPETPKEQGVIDAITAAGKDLEFQNRVEQRLGERKGEVISDPYGNLPPRRAEFDNNLKCSTCQHSGWLHDWRSTSACSHWQCKCKKFDLKLPMVES